ncbi:M48 family metalloprotease [Candidatus Bathyarchaeota archaeon]|nr:M48 family metalloprotease [Candidatus Bathyarchaeota archaeon]
MDTGENILSFTIDTEITPDVYGDLIRFLHYHYVLPQIDRLTNIFSDNASFISFVLPDPMGDWWVKVEVVAGKPIVVRIITWGSVPQRVIEKLREDIFIGVQIFEEQVRRSSFYFAWVEGEPVIPERVPPRSRNVIYRMFSGSMVLLFIIFIVIGAFLFMIIGMYTPIMLVALQFVLFLFSDKIIMRLGNWQITPEKPSVHILHYHLRDEEYKVFRRRFSRETLMRIKAEIYERTLAIGRRIDFDAANEVFSRYGFICRPESMSIKVINVYDIVKKAAEKFSLPIPKIVIANTIIPNAAASGPCPSRGILLITSGLLVQLEDEEILRVIGHEFSHLKGRDPLVLFMLSSAEYLLRVYVFWPFLLFFGYFYLFLALTAVYFIAKFFEAKADLESAIRLGRPEVLAEALRKIGFRRLQFERMPTYRLQEWLGWDPHPPLYFRISRLERIKNIEKIKHPFIHSIKDNIVGFMEALRI